MPKAQVIRAGDVPWRRWLFFAFGGADRCRRQQNGALACCSDRHAASHERFWKHGNPGRRATGREILGYAETGRSRSVVPTSGHQRPAAGEQTPPLPSRRRELGRAFCWRPRGQAPRPLLVCTPAQLWRRHARQPAAETGEARRAGGYEGARAEAMLCRRVDGRGAPHCWTPPKLAEMKSWSIRPEAGAPQLDCQTRPDDCPSSPDGERVLSAGAPRR